MSTSISLGLIIGPNYIKGLGTTLEALLNISPSETTIPAEQDPNTLISTISNKDPRSRVYLKSTENDRFAILNNNLVTGNLPIKYSSSQPFFDLVVVESVSGARSSPREYPIRINILDPNLQWTLSTGFWRDDLAWNDLGVWRDN